jgi:hypothetical protein
MLGCMVRQLAEIRIAVVKKSLFFFFKESAAVLG